MFYVQDVKFYSKKELSYKIDWNFPFFAAIK